MWLGYSRVSKVGERAERLVSPELQAARIQQYCDLHGLAVEMLDPELEVSGGTLERPILSEALDRIDRGEAAGIIVAQLDRLSRAGIYDTLPVIARIESAGGAVIAVAEDFDTSTPEGRMARNVMLSLGAMQREQRGAGFEQARRQAIARGIWVAPRVPLGYVKGVDRRLVPGESADVVRRAFLARSKGAPWAEVGTILGVKPSGAQWLISNRVYLGEVRMRVGGEPVVNASAHPPLVGRALWEAAQVEHPRPPRGSSGPALLAGLIRCAGCSGAMSPTRSAYHCTSDCTASASINRSRVEPYVERVVLSHLRGIRVQRRLGGEAEAAALADAEAELEVFQKATSASGVGVEAFAEGLRARVRAVEEARGVLGRVQARSEVGRIAEVVDLWDSLDVGQRRHVLRGSLDVVWVRSANKRTLPIGERVKLVAVGFAPGLPRQGAKSPAVPVDWDAVPAIDDPEEGGESAGA